MQKLEPPDSHYLSAAQGWLELGNPAEAELEWNRISPDCRGLAAALEVLWEIRAQQKRWEEALEIARKIITTDPEGCSGWIEQSYSLHELKRTEEALKYLLPMAGKFARISTIPYNLACYTCQLGQLDEARKWLSRAMKIGGRKRIREMALHDPDLIPLRSEIAGR